MQQPPSTKHTYLVAYSLKHIEAKAFISHKVKGRSHLGILIKNELINTDLRMKSFLSEEAIACGEHIPKKVLTELIEADIFFVIIDPQAVESRWVRWEYAFCQKRLVRTIVVTHKAYESRLNDISWLNSDEQYLVYYSRNDDALEMDVWKTVDGNREALEQQAREKNTIIINAQTDKEKYCEQNTVRILGIVEGNVQGTGEGNACLHMPCKEEDHPPIHSEDIDESIMIGDDGKFGLEFELPTLHGRARQPQMWFVELKFGRKSELIPILVCDRNNCNDNADVTNLDENNAANQEEMKQLINIRSKGTIGGIPQKINEQIIPRDDKVSALTAMVEQNDKIVITGDKGSGKSVLLCQLYEKISKQQTVLFINCESYLGIESLEQLSQDIIRSHDFIDYVEHLPASAGKMVVIFDSLDAISRNQKAMNIFKRFLQIIWGTGRVKTISSVRSYDYEYVPSIGNTDWGVPYRLGELTRNECNAVLAEMGSPAISSELENILLIPLHLKLLSLIRKRSPDANFTNIKNEIELYDEHWNEYVEKQERADSVRTTLYDIAQKMALVQSTTISRDNFGDPNTIHEILSRNIILSEERHDQIRFFHHAYLDYVASRFIIARHAEFVDFLLENEYNVFLRPTIVFALSVLYQRNPEQVIGVIEKILTSQLKHFWKISALTALAKIDKSSTRSFATLGRLLTEKSMLQRHFLMEINKQANFFWYDLWKDSFFIDWSSSPSNPNSPFIVDYLESVAGQTNDTQSVFKIIRSIVENNKNSWSKRKAIELSSKIDAEGKADWLLELSTNDDTHIRTGVLKDLPKLIETNPEPVPDIFCNIYTYVELSDDVTHAATRGTFALTSTRSQDNRMVIWEAERLFPRLLECNPRQAIASAIKVLEKLRKDKMAESQCNVVEDYGHIWFESHAHTSNESKLFEHITAYLGKCTNKKLKELMPLFNSTPLATFHAIWIDELVKRKEEFAGEIFNAISDPVVFEIATLRRSVKSAIQKAGPFLEKSQITALLHNVMSINSSGKRGNATINNPDRIKAEFLSCFSADALQSEHRKLLAVLQEHVPEYAPPAKEIKIQVGSEKIASQPPSPEETIAGNLGHELKHPEKIKLLNAISQYLDKQTAELDMQKLQHIKEFLIKNKNDPRANDTEQNQDSTLIYDTIRGLVAKSLVKLLYHSKDHALVPLITELSDDPINTVRSEVCSVLKYLFGYDYDLAHQTAKKYSVDESVSVQFYLPAILNSIVAQHPEHAAFIIRNILDKQTFAVADFLIELVFYYKDPSATALLNEIVDDKLFSPKIRSEIPFTLKQSWLLTDEFQDQSFELLYKLLDDPCNEVREKAAFFTLGSLGKDEFTEHEHFVKKIRRHLKRISHEGEREEGDPRLIEELLRFLSNFWHLLPEDAIDYLETIASGRLIEYAKFQPVFAEESVKILTGLFQHTSLSKENRERCLDILDTYAEAGWPDALELLSAMERPD